MPDINFTNQQIVHVTHSLGSAHVPVYVEAEGFERLVEVQYGNGFFDVMFGRVMAYGLVSYSSGSGGNLVLLSTPGSAGIPVKSSGAPVLAGAVGALSAGGLPQSVVNAVAGRIDAGSAGILS